jgi:hypothetical protein
VIRVAGPTSRRFAVALGAVALAAFAAAAVGAPVRSSHENRVTGDEPHYLITAISLAEDASLDVADEYAEERYRPFAEGGLGPQAKAQPDGSLVEPHDPLLPALLAGPAAAGGWLGARLFLTALAGALAALTLWVAVRRLRTPLLPAAVVVGLFSVSAPLAVYGSQLYPELPAALAVVAAVAALTGPLRAGGLAILTTAVAVLPWLGTKYVAVAAVLAVLGLVRLVRTDRRVYAAALAVGLGLSALVFALLHLRWYGGLTPYAAGSHFVDGELTVVGHDPDYAGRSRRLVGLLVDREFGLAAWQPAWLVALPALAALARARPPGWDAIAVPVAVAWLGATFGALTMHGWWFPGRQVVVVLPLIVLAIAWWVARGGRRLAVTALLGLAGVATYGRLVADGLGGATTWVVDFFETGDPLSGAWRELLPSGLSETRGADALIVVWGVVALALLAAGWISSRPPAAGDARIIRSPRVLRHRRRPAV